MSIDALLDDHIAPIIAILRGVAPSEVVDLGNALVDEGIRLIEVPLNSPDPLESIGRLHAAVGHRALIGAGTVLTTRAVKAAAAAGARFIVSPNTDTGVISCTVELGLESIPGFFTATEALAAAAAGARDLKLFPAHSAGITHIAAIREILPRAARIWAVGGINLDNFASWLTAGAVGVGIGGSLFRPGTTVDQMTMVARKLVSSFRSGSSTD